MPVITNGGSLTKSSEDRSDCVTFFKVVVAVYRFWKCTSSANEMIDFGLAALSSPYNGDRDWWFPRTLHTGTQCSFNEALEGGNVLDPQHGRIIFDDMRPSVGPNPSSNGLLNMDAAHGLEMQFIWTERRKWYSYLDLRTDVMNEYDSEVADIKSLNPTRSATDPYIFDLYNAIMLIEQYGELLEEHIEIVNSVDFSGNKVLAPSRSDMCECQNLMRCPNGTVSVTGSVTWQDCTSTGLDIIRRITVVPSWYYDDTPGLVGVLANTTDFWELGGADINVKSFGESEEGERAFKVGTINLQAFDVMVVTLDFLTLSTNMTYGDHYQISVYVDCKPCPPRYICNYETEDHIPKCDSYPTLADQQENYRNCLLRYNNQTSCMLDTGLPVPCENSSIAINSSFQEPDRYKCNQIPYFCEDRSLPKVTWNTQFDEFGNAAPSEVQSAADPMYKMDPDWYREQQEAGIPDDEMVYEFIPGCCKCERHHMPYFFAGAANRANEGYFDNKHDFVQLQVLAVDDVALTVVVELLHGQFYSDFDKLVPDKGDIFVHTPGRADYTPTSPSRAAFIVILEKNDYESLELPLNLPLEPYRRPGEPIGGALSTLEYRFEMSVLLGRTSDVFQADPTYEERFEKHMLDLYRALQNSVNGSSTQNPERVMIMIQSQCLKIMQMCQTLKFEA